MEKLRSSSPDEEPKKRKEMYDSEKHVEDTFEEENLSKELLYAQKIELIELQKAIDELFEGIEHPLSVLDIGVGNARILKAIAQKPEVWEKIKSYEGIDVAQNCVDITTNAIQDLHTEGKANVRLLDAQQLETLKKTYDLIISTWFTVGNFYPDDFVFEDYQPGSYDLSKNEKFSNIFRQAYDLLNPGGEIIIGSMYIDNDETRKKQEEAYKNFGWEIITDERDSFTATKDGWWSQRYTKEQVYNYLDFIPRENITFIPLDDYDYAMMVRIKKSE